MYKTMQICVITALLLTVGAAQADMTVLTFDELTSSQAPIPNGYGGLNWNNMWYLSVPYSSGSGYDNGIISTPNVAFNAYGDPATVTGSPFDFAGAYFTAAWGNDLNVVIEGYLNSTQKYTSTIVIDYDAPTWFNFNYLGIDELRFTSFFVGSGGGTQFAMDNFTLGVAPVPVPGAVLLGILGLSAAGLKLRRFS